jgi:hypothetical protein
MDIFFGHLEYFTDIWDILRPFRTFLCTPIGRWFSLANYFKIAEVVKIFWLLFSAVKVTH